MNKIKTNCYNSSKFTSINGSTDQKDSFVLDLYIVSQHFYAKKGRVTSLTPGKLKGDYKGITLHFS